MDEAAKKALSNLMKECERVLPNFDMHDSYDRRQLGSLLHYLLEFLRLELAPSINVYNEDDGPWTIN